VQLLATAERVKRGLTATDADKATIEKMAEALEAVNPNPESLSAKEINGRWELKYTTSASILGTNRLPFLRPIGPIYQIIGAHDPVPPCFLILLFSSSIEDNNTTSTAHNSFENSRCYQTGNSSAEEKPCRCSACHCLTVCH
jgi:hypothetical protein